MLLQGIGCFFLKWGGLQISLLNRELLNLFAAHEILWVGQRIGMVNRKDSGAELCLRRLSRSRCYSLSGSQRCLRMCPLGSSTALLEAERCWRSLGGSDYGAHAWLKVKEGPA